MNQSTYYNRRTFLKTGLVLGAGLTTLFNPLSAADKKMQVMTVGGLISSSAMRNTLCHEHILVDFIGAEEVNPPRWDRERVTEKVLPFLEEAKLAGCNTFVDCTPNYLGRDVVLLKQLSQKTGLHIITNTGYYGGSDNKFLPAHAFTESAEQLSRRWIIEWQQGIDSTSIKPGFMKISVNPSHLSDVSLKLITAAALTHNKTGLTIASHTGPATPAFEQIEILKANKIDPTAFIWVHAQSETDRTFFIKAAQEGAWVSLDGLNENNVDEYTDLLSNLKKEKCLHKILLSHDAGWYDPAKPEGGEVRGYTVLFKKLIPALEQEGFLEEEIIQIIQKNAANAFSISVKKLKRRGR
ncbi:MAG: phosphotriesterase [Cyclobacteriaceae bacterium]